MAAPGMGLSARNVYAKEPTQNTREVPDHHIEFVNFQPAGGPTWIQTGGHRGGRSTATKPSPGNKLFTYSKTFNMVPQSMGEQLEHLWGSNTTSGAGPYDHTIIPNPTRKTLTEQFIWEDFGGNTITYEYTGAMCTGGSLNVNASGDGSPVQITTNEAAHNLSTAQTAVSASYPTITQRWTSVQTSLTLAGAAVPFTNFTLNWNNNLDIDVKSKVTNAGLADIRPAGRQEFTASLECDFVSATVANYFLTQAENAAVLTVSDGTHSLVLTMNVVYAGGIAGIPESGPIRQPIELMVEHATSDASAFTAVLRNGDAAA